MFFRIENCSVSNPGSLDSGIRLQDVRNGSLVNNIASNANASYAGNGITLTYSNNNTVLGNTANDNSNFGIRLYSSDNNTVSGNTLIGNYGCIYEYDSQGNEFSNNGGCQGGGIIPGYNLFFLLIALSVAMILIRKKLRFTKI